MNMDNKVYLGKQFNRAVQLLSGGQPLTEEEILEIPDIYEPWQAGKKYASGKILKYGLNQYGETQLYSVVTEHVSQDDWRPDAVPALYKPIGFSDDGTPIWSQPYTYEDAWEIGDVVSHNDKLWECTEGNVQGELGPRNTYEPGVWGWREVTA